MFIALIALFVSLALCAVIGAALVHIVSWLIDLMLWRVDRSRRARTSSGRPGLSRVTDRLRSLSHR